MKVKRLQLHITNVHDTDTSRSLQDTNAKAANTLTAESLANY